jgi:hypothetical protein
MIRRRPKRSERKGARPERVGEKGFDLGEQTNAMAVADLEFARALHDAGVFGCAYGLRRFPEFPGPIPEISLIGEHRSGFERAFEAFRRWGCVHDGDCVDVDIMLNVDGTYALWIGPELERLLHRTLPQADLYRRPGALHLSWVKPIDSTHRALLDLKQYRDGSVFSPVAVSAAVCDRANPRVDELQSIPGLPRLIKFDLRIIEERTHPDDPRFHSRTRAAAPEAPSDRMAPPDWCTQRRRTLDIAFPVSRERVRRAGLPALVRAIPGFASVSDTQVAQAAINLTLSGELVAGDRHYSRVPKRLAERVWKYILSRYETADGSHSPTEHPPLTVAHQLELDVQYVLSHDRIKVPGLSFSEQQAVFRERGYIDD